MNHVFLEPRFYLILPSHHASLKWLDLCSLLSFSLFFNLVIWLLTPVCKTATEQVIDDLIAKPSEILLFLFYGPPFDDVNHHGSWNPSSFFASIFSWVCLDLTHFIPHTLPSPPWHLSGAHSLPLPIHYPWAILSIIVICHPPVLWWPSNLCPAVISLLSFGFIYSSMLVYSVATWQSPGPEVNQASFPSSPSPGILTLGYMYVQSLFIALLPLSFNLSPKPENWPAFSLHTSPL